FQAEDGIRDRNVTGVQTCALPISARVLVFDAAGRVLLVRGHDADQVDRTWWFTIGGGIEPGETPRQAAVRELQEEAGISAAEERSEERRVGKGGGSRRSEEGGSRQ